MKMDNPLTGDEVRFRTSPVIINGVGPHKADPSKMKLLKSSARAVEPPRRLRLQASVNAQGQLELNLGSRGLRELPTEVLSLVRLEVLRLHNNHLHALPADLPRLHKLRVLDLHSNLLLTLPETLPNFIHLVELDVSHNQLRSLPQPLSQLRHLQLLLLADNLFESVPAEVGDLGALRKLDLSHNRLWHLPASLGHLQALVCLDLAGNLFDQLPICVCSLRHLEALNLQDNKLINLPAQAEGLHHLKELNLASNHVETVPHVLSQLSALQILDLSKNRLKSVPPRLARLPRLRSLVLHSNAISSLPNNLEALEHLDVSHNQLHNFSLARMKRLRHLDASHNVLENLPLGVYVLPQLETLHLDSNHISYVSQDIVLLHSLRVLDLGHNRLTSLPQVVDELSNLETFNIQGNKIESRPLHAAAHLHHNGGLKGGSRDYALEEEEEEEEYGGEGRRHKPHPLFKKKGGATKAKTKWRQTKAKSPQAPHSRHTGTQYTPKNSVRSRPPLDYVPKSGSLSTLFASPKSRSSLHSRFSSAYNTLTRSHAPTLASEHPHKPVHEIDYPVVNAETTPSQTHNHTPHHSHKHDPSLTSVKQVAAPAPPAPKASAKERERHYSGSIRSDAVTVNETIGDGLSLGDEDFEYQPTTVKDARLMGVCSVVETMLNKQLLQPIMANRGIFRKTVNEGGTLRMLRGFGSMSALDCATSVPDIERPHTSRQQQQHTTAHSPPITHRARDVFMRQPHSRAGEELGKGKVQQGGVEDNSILRTRMDTFTVTAAGGMFRSSADSNVGIYFPVNAVEVPITITMQLERVSQEALQAARKQSPLVDNLLSVGPILHIRQDRLVELNHQVTLTLPTPPSPRSGGGGTTHILTFRENNTCTPCSSQYKEHRGYLTLQTWHFSGKGAMLCRSRNKYKACKSAEQLLRELYL